MSAQNSREFSVYESITTASLNFHMRKSLSPDLYELNKRVQLLPSPSLDYQKFATTKHFSPKPATVKIKAYPRLDPLKEINQERLKQKLEPKAVDKKGRDVSYIKDAKKLLQKSNLELYEIKSIPDLYYSVLPNKLKEVNNIFKLLTTQSLEENALKDYKEMGKLLMKTDILRDIDPMFIEKNKYFLINVNTKPYSIQLTNFGYKRHEGKELGVPSSRHDAVALNLWLDKFLEKLQNKVMPIKEKMDLFQAVYFISLREVIRQISVNCIERGEIVWRIFIAYMLMMNNLHLVYEDKMKSNEIEYQRRIGILQKFYDQESEELKKSISEQSNAKEKAQSELAISHMENKDLRKKLTANTNAVNIEVSKQNQLLKKLISSEQVNNELRKMIKINKQQMFEDLNQAPLDSSSSSEISQLDGANALFKLDNFTDATTDMEGFPEQPKPPEPKPVEVEIHPTVEETHKARIPKLSVNNAAETSKKQDQPKQSIDQLRLNYMKQLELRKNFFVKPSYHKEIQTDSQIDNLMSDIEDNFSPKSIKKNNRTSLFFKKSEGNGVDADKKGMNLEKRRYIALHFKQSTLPTFCFYPRKTFKEEIKMLFGTTELNDTHRSELGKSDHVNMACSFQETPPPMTRGNSIEYNNLSNRQENAIGNKESAPTEMPNTNEAVADKKHYAAEDNQNYNMQPQATLDPNIKVNDIEIGNENASYKNEAPHIFSNLTILSSQDKNKTALNIYNPNMQRTKSASLSPTNTINAIVKRPITDVKIMSNKSLLARIDSYIYEIKSVTGYGELAEELDLCIKTLIKNVTISASVRPKIKNKFRVEVNTNKALADTKPTATQNVTTSCIEEEHGEDLQLDKEIVGNISNDDVIEASKVDYPFKEFRFTSPKKVQPQIINKSLQKLRFQVHSALQIAKNIMDKRSLLRVVSNAYDAILLLERDNRKDLTTFLFDSFATKFGLQSVAEKKVVKIMSSCIYYKSIPRVRVFSRFMKLYSNFSYGDFIFYLDILEFIKSMHQAYNIDNHDVSEHHYTADVNTYTDCGIRML